MRPLKITAILCAPLADDPPMLDALLECAMSRRMGCVMASSNGHRHLTRTNLRNDLPVNPGAIPIPIDRKRVSGFQWPVPCCSSPIFATKTDGVDHYARRFDVEPELIARESRRVYYTNSGEMKAFRLPLRVRSIERIVWFALGRGKLCGNGVGHSGGAPEIRRLLRDHPSIGKKTSQGYGRVKEWIVEPMEEDWSWFAPSNAGNVLMRPLPASAVPQGTIGARPWFGGLVGPYWSSEFFAQGFIPC